MPEPTIDDLRKFKHPKGDPRNYWFDGVSTYVVKALFPTRVTPLQVNFSASIAGVSMGVFFLTGELWGRIVGVVMYFAYITLDAVDGQLARARNDCTLKGHYLDNIGHYVVYPFVSMSIGFGNYLSTGNILIIWAGFLLGLAMTVSLAARDCFKAIYSDAKENESRVTDSSFGRAKKALLNVLRFETMLYLLVLASIVDACSGACLKIRGLSFRFESFIVLGYSVALFMLAIAKAYVFFSRERLISR